MAILIRTVRPADKAWIVDLLKEGAQNRHFAGTVGDQAQGLFDEILARGGFPMQKIRGTIYPIVFVNASIAVAEINEVPASFLITVVDANEVELHLGATHKAFRRKGGLSELIKSEVKKYPLPHKIFGRCYKKSTFAIAMLEKEGFVIENGTNDPKELVLRR